MDRILFVEDEINKAREIRDFLIANYKDVKVDEEKSFQGAINSIRNNKYKLILLDMSLPISDDGSDHETFMGIDVLEELTRIESISQVIIITAYDVLTDLNTNESVKLVDLDKDLREDYSDIYMGAVHYDISSVEWKEILINKIEKVISGGWK
ncbi:response regulator [Enterococcus faecalis]|uniref:response regulator n=1 Tax=Enterococcus faecalis TaxID=1351 RepID=UPI0021DF5204|nr:response regulator [Enterococcus faecalis]EIQ7105765.1 response regulator [Enterococcus faecalis]MCU9756897.1 response regulator [Enterococcus faecalis]MCU9774583.1 response regulator [Enterococcus faecalis]MCU9790447.1 response regulator [Enterococcus faecalis]HEC4825605.1 response regulator [Enterococcus faecalis]